MNPYSTHINSLSYQTLLRCQDIQARSRTRKIFSHTTTLKLLALELPRPLCEQEPTAHVSVSTNTHRSNMIDVTFHRWVPRRDPVEIDSIHDICCSHPIDIWLQVVPLLSRDELVVLAETILRSTYTVTASDFDPACLLPTYPRLNGAHRCEQAFALIRAGSDSSQETRLRLELLKAGLPQPTVNFEPPELWWDNRYAMRFDLAYPQWRLLIEYDGIHHTERAQWHRDVAKRSRARAAGWRVIEITSENFSEASRLVCQIVNAH